MTATTITIEQLPRYPSLSSLSSLTPSHQATLTHSIATALAHTLALPYPKLDSPPTRAFLTSYAREEAQAALTGLIWHTQDRQPSSRIIKNRTLSLAEKLASVLDVQTLLDLSIVYALSHPTRLKALFAASLSQHPHILLTPEIPTAFTALLSPSSGLYALRKTARCFLSLLRAAPAELTQRLAVDKPLMLALARAYDAGLAALARSYGGVRALRPEAGEAQADGWEKVWVETKVDLVDSFGLLVRGMVGALVGAGAGEELGTQAERMFDVIFAMLDLPPSNPSQPTTPFLDRPLLADYQHAYTLSHTLDRALHAKQEKDARLEVLEATLRSFDDGLVNGTDPGALRILLRSSGLAPPKGKSKASPLPKPDEDDELSLKTAQIHAILPSHTPAQIGAMLLREGAGASVERVVGLLLEGGEGDQGEEHLDREVEEYTRERRNVFDGDEIDLRSAWVGKKSQDESTILHDRTFISQVKADILRFAEAPSDLDPDSDSEFAIVPSGARGQGKGKGKAQTIAFEEELEEDGAPTVGVKVLGDGEESGDDDHSDDESSDGEGGETSGKSPEIILELAYIRDATLFDRDARTRRGKGRVELRELTGWSDEQIEGWRIMLERNPKKDKILEKHEFAGNRPLEPVEESSSGGGGDHRGRGRGRGGGGGRGRGAGGARERAWKDKNKASRGNHNRKRGHDKKMARAGVPAA